LGFFSTHGLKKIIRDANRAGKNLTDQSLHLPILLNISDEDATKELLAGSALKVAVFLQGNSTPEVNETTTKSPFDDPAFIPGNFLDSEGNAKFLQEAPVDEVMMKFVKMITSDVSDEAWRFFLLLLGTVVMAIIFLCLAATLIISSGSLYQTAYFPMKKLKQHLASLKPQKKPKWRGQQSQPTPFKMPIIKQRAGKHSASPPDDSYHQNFPTVPESPVLRKQEQAQKPAVEKSQQDPKTFKKKQIPREHDVYNPVSKHDADSSSKPYGSQQQVQKPIPNTNNSSREPHTGEIPRQQETQKPIPKTNKSSQEPQKVEIPRQQEALKPIPNTNKSSREHQKGEIPRQHEVQKPIPKANKSSQEPQKVEIPRQQEGQKPIPNTNKSSREPQKGEIPGQQKAQKPIPITNKLSQEPQKGAIPRQQEAQKPILNANKSSQEPQKVDIPRQQEAQKQVSQLQSDSKLPLEESLQQPRQKQAQKPIPSFDPQIQEDSRAQQPANKPRLDPQTSTEIPKPTALKPDSTTRLFPSQMDQRQETSSFKPQQSSKKNL
jgi:hypothetical protein